jgi:carbamoyl-phosphate synthase large subunit
MPDEQKAKIVDAAKLLAGAGWHIYATLGTHAYLKSHGIASEALYKLRNHKEPTVQTAIAAHRINLMVNVPSSTKDDADARDIRRLAIDNHIPLVTNAEIGVILLRCLGEIKLGDVPIKSWQEYVKPTSK